ncbi:MAG TPA: hypothetical protein VFH78_12240 [Candidatus Thermoplasmatota archaeon]|nr:hypothetical protein [Candidatus Thermoplasmatota archaeon]
MLADYADPLPAELISADVIVDRAHEAELHRFKRFKVEGLLLDDEGDWPFVLNVSLRGAVVMISLDKKCRWSSYAVYFAIEQEMRRWNHGRHLSPDSAWESLPLVEVADKLHPVYATVRDPAWFLDVLHHLRDDGPFEHVFGPWVKEDGRFWNRRSD